MADKEATVYVVDVGKSTGESHHGRDQTDLDWALTYIWDRMTSIIALDRKTTLQGVVAVRTDDTSNEMGLDSDYYNISVLQNLKALSLSDLRELQKKLTPSSTNRGDAISALVIAIDMIAKTCKKLKYIRRIVMVISGEGAWADENIEEIAQKLKEDDIALTVLGIDFGPDPEDGSGVKKERSKAAQHNEALVQRLLVESAKDGDASGSHTVFAPLEDAIEELGIPRLKTVRPVPSFKGMLMLGDPASSSDAMTIDVERYPRTMVRKPPTSSAFAAIDAGPGQASGADSSATIVSDGNEETNLTTLRTQRTYEVVDASFPKGKKEVPFEELAKGYEYGRTAVHVSESDLPILRMETQSGLEIVGFIPAGNFGHYMALSRSNVILAQRTNPKAIIALSSFVHALHELSSVAVARFTAKADKSPELILLGPVIEREAEYLVDVSLPFAEDVRGYRFPPLDRVILASGKTLSVHRHLPDDKLQSAMDKYVDAMDLDTYHAKDEWDPSTFAGRDSDAPHDAFAPIVHRIDQAIRHRASHPHTNIPAPYPILTKYANPPADLVPDTRLSDLIATANVKKVPPQAAATHRRRVARDAAATPLSGLDVTALLAKRTPQPAVDPENPIPSFRQMLDTTRDPKGIQRAAEQMGAVIERHVREAVGSGGAGGAGDARILEELRVLRAELVEMEEPGLWNDWAQAFRGKLLRGELGGERRELWWKVRIEGGNAVGLIEGGRSGVNKEAAEEYWTLRL